MKIDAISLVAACCLFIEGLAINCYQCSSSPEGFNAGCLEETLNPAYNTPCEEGENYCSLKIIKNTTGEDFSVYRSCSREERDYPCTLEGDMRTCNEECSSDGCNAGHVIPSMPAVQQCYVCSSSGRNPDAGCEGDTLNPAYRTDCPEGQNYCDVKYYYFQERPTSVKRGCSAISSTLNRGSNVFSFSINSCREDNCNTL